MQAEEEQPQQSTENRNAESAGQTAHQLWVAEDVDDDSSSQSTDSSEHISVASAHDDQIDEQQQQPPHEEQQQKASEAGSGGEPDHTSGSDEETPLSRAMARAVKEFEDAATAAAISAVPQQQHAHRFIVDAQENPAPKQSAPPVPQPVHDDAEGSGAFGIEYRPFKQEVMRHCHHIVHWRCCVAPFPLMRIVAFDYRKHMLCLQALRSKTKRSSPRSLP
jgi:hypothetical protein